jgi:hypothetical protein
MATKYTITTNGQTFTRKSKRADFRFAVVYHCSIMGWGLAGLRTTREDAEKLQAGYAKNLASVIVPICGSPA